MLVANLECRGSSSDLDSTSFFWLARCASKLPQLSDHFQGPEEHQKSIVALRSAFQHAFQAWVPGPWASPEDVREEGSTVGEEAWPFEASIEEISSRVMSQVCFEHQISGALRAESSDLGYTGCSKKMSSKGKRKEKKTAQGVITHPT